MSGSARLLHLISQLLPGDPVGNTALVSGDMQRRASAGQDLEGAILGLFEEFCQSEECVRNIRQLQHVLKLRTPQGVAVTKVLKSEWAD